MKAVIRSNHAEIVATLASLLFDVAGGKHAAKELDKQFIFDHMASVLDLSERDFGRAVNLLLALVEGDDDLLKMVQMLSTPSSAKHNGLQLQFLVYLYNDTGKAFILVAIIKAAARFHLLDRLSPLIDTAQDFVSNHLSRLSRQDQKSVLSYLAVHNVASFGVQYLQLADAGTDKSSVLKCIGSLVRSNRFIDLQQVVSFDCVKGNDLVADFLRLLLAGDAVGFEAFAEPEKIDDLFDQLELSFDQCMNKIRLVAFAKFAGDRVGKSISYQESFDALQINDDLLLESIVIDATKSNIVDAQMDQQNRTIRISNVGLIQWNADRWTMLAGTIEALITTLDR